MASIRALFNFFKHNVQTTIAVLLATLLGGSLYAFNSIEEITQSTKISSIIWILIIIIFNIICITLTAYALIRRKGQKIFFIATLSSLILYIFLYYLRLSSSNLAIGGLFFLNTRTIASVGILILYGVAAFYLLRKEILPFALRAALAFLTILSTFSYFSFVADNSSRQSVFALDLLNILINGFSPLPWLILTAATLAFITRADLNFRKMKDELPAIASLICINLTVLFSIYFISISGYGVGNIFYWQQSFLMFIMWDFVYKFTHRIYDEKNTNYSFIANWKEIVYYGMLFLIVLFSSYLFGRISFF